MKGKVKRKLRVVSLCLITLLMVIPLLSQPVAAITSMKAGVVETNASSTPPSVTITPNPTDPYFADDDEDHIIVFEFDYNFTDDTWLPAGSNHVATISVWYTDVVPWDFVGTDTTGTVFLNVNNNEEEGTLEVTESYDPGTLPRTYSVIISASCQELTTNTSTSSTPPSLTVIVS